MKLHDGKASSSRDGVSEGPHHHQRMRLSSSAANHEVAQESMKDWLGLRAAGEPADINTLLVHDGRSKNEDGSNKPAVLEVWLLQLVLMDLSSSSMLGLQMTSLLVFA